MPWSKRLQVLLDPAAQIFFIRTASFPLQSLVLYREKLYLQEASPTPLQPETEMSPTHPNARLICHGPLSSPSGKEMLFSQ